VANHHHGFSMFHYVLNLLCVLGCSLRHLNNSLVHTMSNFLTNTVYKKEKDERTCDMMNNPIER